MIAMNAEINRTKEGSRFITFTQAFRDVSRNLSGAYSVPEDFYSQAASRARFENGISINSAKEFLDHVHYDPDKAAGIAEDLAISHKLADTGVTIGPAEFVRLGPDSKVNGRSLTIAALAQRAARLESLLTPNGIPEAYATAQTQVRRALNVVERAAGKAYDWSPGWGRLSVDNALNQAKGAVTSQKIAQASMVGILALAGCGPVTVSFTTPEITTGQGTTPTAAEVVPAWTETPAPTATASPEPTQTETATQTPTETPAPAVVPILGPLPADTDPQLPFPGYKEEHYAVGWNSLKDDWNRLWTKWGLMAADQLGPRGSLVVRPVEGEAGIDCEDAVDGSYKGMTLCPPLDVVHGGLLPFPGMDTAANTDYYPLFIQRSSQYARLKSVGTGTGLVLQEVDSAGKPTRYIKPKNNANGKGGVWVDGEYVPPLELPATDHILSPDQLAEKQLYGSGFEIKTEFRGIPVDLTIVTSNATLAQYNQTRGCMPNQEMVKYGASAEDRMAEMVFLGHYVGYLRDRGLTEGRYPFTQYVADLTAGKDRSYTIWGVRPDQSVGEFEIDPLAPVEYVTTNAVVDPDGNGRGIGLHGDNISRFGYQQRENGGVRIVEAIRSDYKNYRAFCDGSSMALSASLIYLGAPLEFLKGKFPLVYPPDYPIAVVRQWEIWFDDRIWKDSQGLLAPSVLVP